MQQNIHMNNLCFWGMGNLLHIKTVSCNLPLYAAGNPSYKNLCDEQLVEQKCTMGTSSSHKNVRWAPAHRTKLVR